MEALDPNHRRFNTIGDELGARLELAKESGDREAERLVIEFRYGFAAAGVSASQFKWKSRAESDHGNGKAVVASFDARDGGFAMAEFGVVTAVAEKASQGLRQTVTGIIEHEQIHDQIHRKGKRVRQMIGVVFGEEISHDIEEATASLGTTETFDAYDNERRSRDTIASRLNLTRYELADALINGEEQMISEHIVDAGLYPIDLPAANDLANDLNAKAI